MTTLLGITLYGAIANGHIWGIGLSRDGAAFDAGVHLTERHTRALEAGQTEPVAMPMGGITVEEISYEECKRMANGDTRRMVPRRSLLDLVGAMEANVAKAVILQACNDARKLRSVPNTGDMRTWTLGAELAETEGADELYKACLLSELRRLGGE